jgi:predicted phage terminase large subunit-like protein
MFDKSVFDMRELYHKLIRSIPLFGRVCFASAFQKEIPPFHHKIYEKLLDKSMRRLLIAAPRGSAKSTLISLIFPLFKVAFKKPDEDMFIVIISESQAQSINFLNRIKYHLNKSTKFKALFGDLGADTARRWTATDIILANGARIVAVGTGQRVRGFIEGDTRPTLVIVDDFESELNAATPEARMKNRKWVTEAVIPSLADDGQIVMVGTVISEDCFLNWAKTSSAWTVLWFSILDDEGKSIWPDKFPMKRIEAIREEYRSVGNDNGFFQEYMNQAQSPDEAPFQPEYLQYTHQYHYQRVEGHPCLVGDMDADGKYQTIIPVELYGGVDPASSLSVRADFFVFVTLAKDADDNVYVVDIFREHIAPASQPDKIIELYRRFNHHHVKIETIAYQEALRDHVRRLMREQNIHIMGLEKGVKPKTRKSERLLSLVPLLASGKFFFRKSDIMAIEEFKAFPKGKHDDIMDGIWTALQGAKPCRIRSIEKKEDEEKQGFQFIDWLTR